MLRHCQEKLTPQGNSSNIFKVKFHGTLKALTFVIFITIKARKSVCLLEGMTDIYKGINSSIL